MPEEAAWSSFFDAPAIIGRLLSPGSEPCENVVEFGCGYGTFTIPAAKLAKGIVSALDIDPGMVACVQRKALELGLDNLCVEQRDFVAQNSGLGDGTQCHAMIYNLLHLENPVALLREAARTLKPGGKISVIHWRSDIRTPRGPSLAIRPSPEQCSAWLLQAGFHVIQTVDLEDLCPYHFGLVATR